MACRQAAQGLWLLLLLALCLEGAQGQCNPAVQTSGDDCTREGKANGQFLYKTIYQDAPYPNECNNFTVFLKLDVSVNLDTAIRLSGFHGASNCRSDNLVVVEDALGSLASDYNSAGCDSGTRGFGTWDPVLKTVSLYPTRLIPADTMLAFHFTLKNPSYGMASRTIFVATDGGRVIKPTAMWKDTTITALSVNSGAHCFPADNSNAEVRIVPGMQFNRTTYSASLVTRSRVDIVDRKPRPEVFEHCKQNSVQLSVDGVQKVDIDVSGCGCTATSGKIFAAKPGTGAEADGKFLPDGKFEGSFQVHYRCRTGNGWSGSYSDIETCAEECTGAEKICTGMVNENSIQIINPGWGYTTAPTLFVKDLEYSFKTLVGEATGCDVKFKATVLSGAGFDATYDKTTQTVTVNNHGMNYTEDTTSPRVSIHCPGAISAISTALANSWTNHTLRAIVGGKMRHPFSASAEEIGFDREECLRRGTKVSCYSHTNVESITITNWTHTTTECATAVTAVMRPDKVTIPDRDYCDSRSGLLDGLRSTWDLGRFAEWSVWGDAAPLKVYNPMFLLRRISQSTSEPGKTNTLRVSLSPSVRLVQGSNITISGLVNAIHEKGPVNFTYHQGPRDLTGRWTCAGTVVITVGACTFWPGHVAVLSFNVVNNRPSQFQTGLDVSINATAGACVGRTVAPDEEFLYPFAEIHDPIFAPSHLRDTYGPGHKYWVTQSGISIRPGVDAQQAKAARGNYNGSGCVSGAAGELGIPTAHMFLGTKPSDEYDRDFRGSLGDPAGEQHSADKHTWPLTVLAPMFEKHRVWQTHAYPDPDCAEDPDPPWKPTSAASRTCTGTCTCDGAVTGILRTGTCSQAGETCNCEKQQRKHVGRAAATASDNGKSTNILHFEFAVNVNVSSTSYFRIKGLKGVHKDSPGSRTDIELVSTSESTPLGVFQNMFCNALDGYNNEFAELAEHVEASSTESSLCTGRKINYGMWDNTEKTLSLFPSRDLSAGQKFVVSIDVDTYEEDTATLDIEIALSSVGSCVKGSGEENRRQSVDYEGRDIPFTRMDLGMQAPTDPTGGSCPGHIFNQFVSETVPFVVRKPKFYTARMRQQHPFAMPMAKNGDAVRTIDTSTTSATAPTTLSGRAVVDQNDINRLNQQRRNWIRTTLVSNVPMSSASSITIRNLKGRNFTEISVEDTASDEFSFFMPQDSIELQLTVISKDTSSVQTGGQRVWPGQVYRFSIENRNHFPQEMLANAVVSKSQQQACGGNLDAVQCMAVGALGSRVGCCRWDNGCLPRDSPTDSCNGVLLNPRAPHTIGSETRKASDIKIESTGCVAIPARQVTFDRPKDARYCKGYSASHFLYDDDHEWKNDPSCLDLDGCITLEDFNPFRVLPPTFCVKTIEQTNNLPGKENVITVTLRALFDIPSQENITVAGLGAHSCDYTRTYGWPSTLPPTLGPMATALGTTVQRPTRQYNLEASRGARDCFGADCNGWSASSCNPLDRHIVITTGMEPLPTGTPTGIDHQFYWEAPAGREMVFQWKLERNWNSTELALIQQKARQDVAPYGPVSFDVATLKWVEAPVELIAPAPASGICDMTSANLDRRPLSVQVPRLCGCTSEISNPLPGEKAWLTFTFKTNVNFPNGLDILPSTDLVLTGLVKQSSFQNLQFTLEAGQFNKYEPTVEGNHLRFRQWNTTHNRLLLNPTADVAQTPVEAQAEAPATVSFRIEVQNPVPPARSPDFESAPFVLEVPSMPNLAQRQLQCGKVKVEAPRWTFAKAGQVTPYPCSDNAISVTLVTNYVPNDAMFILIEGLPSSVFEQSTESSLQLTEVKEAFRTGQNESLGNFTNPVDNTNQAGRGLLLKDGSEAKIWFKVPAGSKMMAGQQHIFSFPVKNPGSPLDALPTMKVSAYTDPTSSTSQDFKKDKTKMTEVLREREFEYDTSTAALCESDISPPRCVYEVYQPEEGDARPLYIREPRIVRSFIGQSKPFALVPNNIITVSLHFNVHLYSPSKLQLRNFKGLTKEGAGAVVDVSTGNTGFCPDILEEDVAVEDLDNMLSITFGIKDGKDLNTSRAAGSPLTIRMAVTNPDPHKVGATAQYEDPANVQATLPGGGTGCNTQCCVKMSTRQDLDPPQTLEQLENLFGNPNTDILNAVRSPSEYGVTQKLREGAPLYLRRPTFRAKQIWQELPHPLAVNTIYLQIGANVPLTVGTLIQISGFTSKNPDLVPRGTSLGSAEIFPLMCGTGEDCTGSQYFAPNTDRQAKYYSAECVNDVAGQADNVGTGCRKMTMKMYVLEQTSANLDYYLAFKLENPGTEQAAPTISIRAYASVRTDWEIMETPKLTCLKCGTIEDSKALYIRQTTFGSSTALYVRQTNPFSRGHNFIVVSLFANGNLKAGTKITISGFREWDAGLIHLNEVHQSEGFAKDFGIKTTANDCTGERCTDLTQKFTSYDNGIVYARIKDCTDAQKTMEVGGTKICSDENKLAGVGCRVPSVLTDEPGTSGRSGSGLKIEVKVDCGRVTIIKIQEPGQGYLEPTTPTGRTTPTGPFEAGTFGAGTWERQLPNHFGTCTGLFCGQDVEQSPWHQQVKCTTPPEIEWYRSHDLIDRAETKYHDSSNTLTFEIDSDRETADCVALSFKFPVFNPITATDTNPPPSYPLNLTVTAKYEKKVNNVVKAVQTFVEVPLPTQPNAIIPDPVLTWGGVGQIAGSDPDAGVCQGLTYLNSANQLTDCNMRSISIKTGDSVPMRIYTPTFLTATVQQSMPYPGAFNEIFVTLMTNFDLRDTEDILITFNLGSAVPPDAPSPGGTFTELSPYSATLKPRISGTPLAPTQDVLTTSQTPSPSIASATGGYVNISGFVPPHVLETTLFQHPSAPEVSYYYGDYIEVCADETCASSREVFKVLAYSKTTRRLRLRRMTPLRGIACPSGGCFVYKTVYLENIADATADDMAETASTVFGGSAQWISNTTSGHHMLNISIETGKTFKGGHVYRFKFTVRNPMPVEPYDASKYQGATTATVRVESRDTTNNGLDKKRIEYALGSRANHKVTMLKDAIVARTKTADGQDFSDVTVSSQVSATADIVDVSGTKVTRTVAPGAQVQIGSEIMTVVHAMQRDSCTAAKCGARLLVKRAQQNTAAAVHAPHAQVKILLPGIQTGDGIPFKVQRKAVILSYMRQTTAMPGAANRLVTTLAFNYPLNALDTVSITGLKGYTLRTTRLGDPCATTPIPRLNEDANGKPSIVDPPQVVDEDMLRAYATLCPTRSPAYSVYDTLTVTNGYEMTQTSASFSYSDNDRLFKYLSTVHRSNRSNDASAMNERTLGLDLGSFGEVFSVSGLSRIRLGNNTFTNSSNFTKEEVQLPVVVSSRAGTPCLTNSLRQAFDRFDYDGDGVWSGFELADYAEAYNDDQVAADVTFGTNPTTPATTTNMEDWEDNPPPDHRTFPRFVAYVWRKYTGQSATGQQGAPPAGGTMTKSQYYEYTRHFGVMHSMHAVDGDNSTNVRVDVDVTWEEFQTRFENEPDGACPAFRPGDFVVVQPTDKDDDEEVLLVTEIPAGNQPTSVSYNVYRGQLFDAHVPDHQVQYNMFALYEHGGDGGVFSGEFHSRTSGRLQSGNNLVPPGQLLPFSIDVINPGSSSSEWKSSDQPVGSPQWNIIGKNLQQDSSTGKLTLRSMKLKGGFSVEQGQSTLFEPDGVATLGPGLLEAGDLLPTKTYRTGLLGNRIMPSNYCPGAPVNTITVTLVPSVPIPAFLENQTSIVFSNFRGAVVKSGDGSFLKLSGEDADNFRSVGQWNVGSGGNQTLTVNVSKPLKPGKRYIFSFNVTNPMMNQSGSNISVHTTGMITGVILPFNETRACGCAPGVYTYEAEEGYGGSGFEAEVTISDGKVVGSPVIKKSGQGYTGVPLLKMTKFLPEGLAVHVTCANKYTCGKCSDCGLSTTSRKLLANIDGVQAVSNVTIRCSAPQINAEVTLNVTEGGFGRDFRGIFTTTNETHIITTNVTTGATKTVLNYSEATSIMVVHPGTGYMYIPYSVSDEIEGDGCDCTQSGRPYFTDSECTTPQPLTEAQFASWQGAFFTDGQFEGSVSADKDAWTCDWLFEKYDEDRTGVWSDQEAASFSKRFGIDWTTPTNGGPIDGPQVSTCEARFHEYDTRTLVSGGTDTGTPGNPDPDNQIQHVSGGADTSEWNNYVNAYSEDAAFGDVDGGSGTLSETEWDTWCKARSRDNWRTFCAATWSTCVRKSTLCRCQGPSLILPEGCQHHPTTPGTTPHFTMAGGRLFGPTMAKHDDRLDRLPLFIKEPVMTEYSIGQEAPWPEAYNTITVTLRACITFPEDTKISLTGFDNATKDTAGTDSDGSPLEDRCECVDDTTCTTSCPFRRSVTETPKYVFLPADPEKNTRTTIVLTVKKEWPENLQQILTFRIKNPMVIAPDYHPPPPLYISVSLPTTPPGQKYINDTLMTVDADAVHGGIKGGRVPLAIWSDTWPTCFKDPVAKGISKDVWRVLPQTYPRKPSNRYDLETTMWLPQDYPVPFHAVGIACPNHTAPSAFDSRECPENGIVPAMNIKYVYQSNCEPGARNTITVTFASNVPLGKTCQHPCLPDAKITLRGLTGYSMDWATGSLTPESEYGVGRKNAWAASLRHVTSNGDPNTPYVEIEDVDASGAAGDDGVFGKTADFEVLPAGEGEIIFSLQDCQYMLPGRNYSVKFNIMNGQSVQDSPPDIYVEVSATGIEGGYERGASIGNPLARLIDVEPRDGRHLGAACYEADGCHNVRLATSVYIDKPKGVPDGAHQPLLIVYPGEFSEFKLYFGSMIKPACGQTLDVGSCKPPSESALLASSQKGERDAEIILEFKLGDWASNTLKLSIHNNTKGNYTKIRSKRYIWLKFPITVEPTGDKVQFQIEGVDANSRLKRYPYRGEAVCSDGMRNDTDPPHGAPNAEYKCSQGFNKAGRTEYTSVQDAPRFWKLLLVIDPETSYKADGTGSSILENGNKVFDEKTYGGVASDANGQIRIRMTGLRYSRHGVSVENSKSQFGYFSLAADCRDGSVKNASGLNSLQEEDWWITGSDTSLFGFVKPKGVGSLYPSSVDYWQDQPIKGGGTRRVKRVLDYAGDFAQKDPAKPWKDQRMYSDVELRFTVNNIFNTGESVIFSLGTSTQSIKCTAASKTANGWTVTWNSFQATVTRAGDTIEPGWGVTSDGVIKSDEPQVVVVMEAADFKCYLPENGLNPDDGRPLGMPEGLSLGTFRVSHLSSNADGRFIDNAIVDVRHPVYKYQCVAQTIRTREADFCTGVYPVRMCAVSDSAVSDYVRSKNYGNARGFSLLIDGYPNKKTVYGNNITWTLPASNSISQQMRARCDAVHTQACQFNGAPEAVTANYVSKTTTDFISDEAIQMICCAHSPETHQMDEAGIGNLATCIQNSDCDDIEAGVESFLPEMPLVAKAESVCCDYCYEFYGSVSCADAQNRAPGLVDGTGTSDADPPQQQPYVVSYCKNTIQCTDVTPCKGYTFGGKGTTLPQNPSGPITVATLMGDGIVIQPDDINEEDKGKAITITEVAVPPELPAGLVVAGTVVALGPPGLTFNNPVPLSLGLGKPAATDPGSSSPSSASSNTTNSTRRLLGFNDVPETRRVMGLNGDGTEAADGAQKVIIHKWVAGVNPNNGDPLPAGWMPVTATEKSTTVNAFGETVDTAKCLITGFSIYAPLTGVDYPNMGPKGIAVGPYPQTPSSAGKEVYVGFAAFFVILALMYFIVLLPSWAREPPPPPPPQAPPAPKQEPPKPKPPPPPALPASKPMYVQAEPVRFHHGTPIKHFGPTFDDIFDKDDLNWWASEQSKADYNFPKLPFDPKADAQLGYNQSNR